MKKTNLSRLNFGDEFSHNGKIYVCVSIIDSIMCQAEEIGTEKRVTFSVFTYVDIQDNKINFGDVEIGKKFRHCGQSWERMSPISSGENAIRTHFYGQPLIEIACFSENAVVFNVEIKDLTFKDIPAGGMFVSGRNTYAKLLPIAGKYNAIDANLGHFAFFSDDSVVLGYNAER